MADLEFGRVFPVREDGMLYLLSIVCLQGPDDNHQIVLFAARATSPWMTRHAEIPWAPYDFTQLHEKVSTMLRGLLLSDDLAEEMYEKAGYAVREYATHIGVRLKPVKLTPAPRRQSQPPPLAATS